MANDIDIRSAVPADVQQIAKLAGALVRDHHAADPERFFLPEQVEEGYAWWLARELSNQHAALQVAESAAGVVGYAYGALRERDWNMLIDTHAMLHDVFVAPEARRAGVGRKLLLATLTALAKLGAPRVVLSTRHGNASAERLFASLGFRPTMQEMMRASGDA